MASISDAMYDVHLELINARKEHPAMHSGHEGWAVIKEELDELWEEVRKRDQDRAARYLEAKQTAAMAIRFMREVCR